MDQQIYNQEINTKLFEAVRYGNVNTVLEALKSGFNPNGIGLFKRSMVHEAAHCGEKDILKLLLAYKGDVNAVDQLHGNTPLHYAAQEDNTACVSVLLKAGARTDIKNKEGLTCMGQATFLCKDIIQEFVNGQSAGSDWKGDKDDLNNNPKASTMNGIRTPDKWDQIASNAENAAIGYLHLSFEYHKSNLKIRVWQVSDLLLPPPQTSMIESIYVQSLLTPDAVRKSNRRTEEVLIEQQSKDPSQPPQTGIQHIFTPSSFRFDTPLLYLGITPDIVAQRNIQIEVCMIQKHTRKTFLMGMLHMPLRTAVRQPLREKYPLIPCMNHTIPNTMRVYSARDILTSSTLSLNYSLSRSNSSFSSTGSSVTARDVHSGVAGVNKFMQRFTSLNLDSDESDDAGSNTNIISNLSKSIVSSTATVDVISVNTDDDDELPIFLKEVMIRKKEHPHSEPVDAGNGEKPTAKKKIIPNELIDSDEESDPELKISSGEKTSTAKQKEPEEAKKKDVLLETDLNPPKIEGNKPESSSEISPSGKKKIIPPEFLSNIPSRSEGKGQSVKSPSENTCVYDDIHEHKTEFHNNVSQTPQESSVLESPVRVVINEVDQNCSHINEKKQEVELTLEISHTRPRALSIVSGSSSTPVSRPETPVWDFYDFTLENQEVNEAEGIEEESGAPKDEASKALGTLQESILRLSRASKLDTCRVSGPVLPTVMLEDFEMDNEEEIVSDNEEENTDNICDNGDKNVGINSSDCIENVH